MAVARKNSSDLGHPRIILHRLQIGRHLPASGTIERNLYARKNLPFRPTRCGL